jgi:hypothetical protein
MTAPLCSQVLVGTFLTPDFREIVLPQNFCDISVPVFPVPASLANVWVEVWVE